MAFELMANANLKLHLNFGLNRRCHSHVLAGFLHISILFVLASIFSSVPFRHVYSDSARLPFKRAPIDLKTSSYGAVLQDKDGFIWFSAVGRGVYRYDGHELRNFNKGPNELSGSIINAIVEDSKGNIWLGSLSEGITRYDKETDSFTHFKHSPTNTNSLSSNNLPFSPRSMLVDRSDRLWVGTQGGGLSLYDQETSTWTRFRHDPADSNSLSSNAVLALATDQKGQIWVGTKGGGLDLFNPDTDQWTHFIHKKGDTDGLSDNWINAIIEDSRGDMWIGTKEGGLNRYEPSTGTFYQYHSEPEKTGTLASNEIWNLYEDSSGNIWVSHPVSALGGLSMFDRKRQTFVRYPPATESAGGLSSNGIVGIQQDAKTGIIWVINSDGAIDVHDPLATTFTVYQSNPNDPKSISGSAILPIAEDMEGTIWIGTFNSGLNAFDRDRDVFRRFKPDPLDDRSIPQGRLSALTVDSSGALWIGSWGGVLTEFDPKRGISIRHYTHDEQNAQSITESERVKYILEDKNDPDILWVGTIGGGLDKFNKKTGQFKHFKHDPNDPDSLSHNAVVTIFDDENGFLWVTTYGGGLEKLDKETGKFTHFRHDPNDPNSISSNTLYEVNRDAEGILWVSGKGGISRFDEKSQSFKSYASSEGLPSDIISDFLEDSQGNLWLGTIDAGLIRFDPKTGTHRQFTEADGLPSNTFYWTSRLKSRDGTMWFGGANGLVRFHPDKITTNPFVPPVRLTAIRQGGRDLDLGAAAERVKRIDLDWRNNYFEFQFAALGFSQSGKNTFAYKLEGRDKDWYYSGSSPFGRYTGLPGGEYILRLKAANSSGLWNEEGLTVKVFVKPPFWETMWFYAAASVVSILFAVMMVWRYRSIVSLNRVLAKNIAERKRAEQALRNALESEKNYTSLQRKFISLVSHEFRTPLTIIDGTAQRLIRSKEKLSADEIKKKSETIRVAVQRMTELIENTLYAERLEGGGVEIHLEAMDLGRTLLDLAAIHNETSLFHDVVVDVDGLPPTIVGDEKLLSIVFNNLLSNAIKFSPNAPAIDIKGGIEGDYAVVSISDQGVGISEHDLSSLFERFFRAKSAEGIKGTGIGLNVVKEFVEIHGGDISVSSHEGEGTTFTVMLPITPKGA